MIVFTLLLTAVSLASAASLPAARCDFTGLIGAAETSRPLSTQEKAKDVAARRDRIGIVSEIGAGQEIARALINAADNGGVVHESRSDYKTGASDALYGSLGPNATIEDYASRRRLLGQLSTDFDRVPGITRYAPA